MVRVLRSVRAVAMLAAVALGTHLDPGSPALLSGPSPAEAMHHPVEGFGAGTTGGAGRPICTVTSLANSGPGTLRDCLSTGNRQVEFAVAGTISLSSTIDVPSNVTIDGFSAPSPGITVTNRAFNVWDTSNIIMQGFRIQNVGFVPPRDPETEEGTVTHGVDCISVYGGAVSRLVFNHMSIVGCGDGSIDISTGPKDITIQWSILSTWKGALWGTTGGGSATAVTDRISMHHTLMVCNDRPVGCDRFPLIRASGFLTRVDLRNNVFEGWIRANGTKIEDGAWVNIVGNAYIPRADSTFDQRERSLGSNDDARVFTAGNIELGPTPRPNLDDNGNQSSPFPAPAISARPLGCVVRDAGAHPRDSVDARLARWISEVPAGCSDVPSSPPPPPPPPTGRPDLVARALTAPSTATAGQTLSLGATLANVGTAAAPGSTARLYLSTDRTVSAGDAALGSIAVPSLAVAATHTGTRTVTLPATLPAGAHMLLVQADGGGTISESDESNNTLAIPITVTTRPSSPFAVLLQAEAMAVTSTMSVGADSGALGGRYLSPTRGANSTTPVREASASVTIPTAGTYHLWARMYGPTTGSDALYLGIDSAWRRAYPTTTGTYQWVQIGTSGFPLAPGAHTIQVGRGEVDTRLDAVYLTSTATDVPTFTPQTASFVPVLLQAESMARTSGMRVGSDSGALGGRYLRPASGGNSTTPVREASVSVTIPTPGTYYLWARMYGPSRTADALYLGIGPSWDRAFTTSHGTYQWVRIETGNGSGTLGFQLAPGSHTIQVGRGEVDTRLDAVYLTNTANDVPTFGP